MPINLNAEQLTRISLVRYLFKHAEERANEPSPLRSLSLLPMHDAVEMLLDLIAEVSNAPPSSKREFKEYWRVIAQAEIPFNLPMQRPMEKLNRARVALKHHGQRISDDQIKEHLVTTRTFIDEACIQCFGTSLNEISLAGLIKDEQVRGLINIAVAELQNENMQAALANVATAFARASAAVYSKFSFSFRSVSFNSLDLGMDRSFENEIGRVTKPIKDAIKTLSENHSRAIALVSLGIDLRDYELFRSLTPVVHITISGKTTIQWMHSPTQDIDTVQWCIDFVIEFMLRLESRETQVVSIRQEFSASSA